ncbi:MAG TPA: ATP-binding cassette domain-containing protein [Candidatus Dormibacteraeota bacterium]|nr:ATP-binding cassette domain-containing protein [Candidatus Dormibacteraeota bacterium]
MLEAQVVKQRRDLRVEAALRVETGASLALFGPSAAGKSTVLSCIAGAEVPDEGRIELDGRILFPPSLALARRNVGYLTQSAELFPHLTVEQNVRFGVPSEDGRAHQAWIAELTETLSLAPVWNASAGRISGGQARRVAIARMMARRPPLVLLDEPFAGLDRDVVRALVRALREWQRRIGFSIIAVDHHAETLERLCGRVLVIEGGRGVQEGTWEEVRRAPATPRLQSLLAPL